MEKGVYIDMPVELYKKLKKEAVDKNMTLKDLMISKIVK